jgi:preprotein translocase subunit SecA
MNRHELGETIFETVRARYDVKEQILGAPAMRYHERIVMLSVLDGLWKDHLLAMDHLKEGIGLRGYAQQDPLVAYKKESFEMFEAMMMQFQQDTARHLFRMQIIGPDGQPIETVEQMPQRVSEPSSLSPPVQQRLPMPGQNGEGQAHAPVPIPTRAPSTTIDELEREFARKKKRELEQARAAGAGESTNGSRPRVTGEKVGRNDPCPCGSGKKYKKCHGAQA